MVKASSELFSEVEQTGSLRLTRSLLELLCLLELGCLLKLWSLGLRGSLISKQVEEVEPRCSLSKDGGLDSESIVWSVEVDSSHLTKLDISSQLRGGNSLSILTTEAEASLETWTDGVGVTIVDAASHESSNAIVTVSIQLDSASEGGAQTLAIAHLSCHTQLGNNLTIGVNRGAQAGSEAQVTVSTKETA